MRSPLLPLLLLLVFGQAMAAQPLQAWLDAAAPGSTLNLPPGTYRGPATIDKPLTLDGKGQVIIDGGGRGTVLTIRANDVTLRGLHLRGSGESHDALDSALHAEGQRLHIEDNRIEDALFGIVLHNTRDSIVRHNRIRSKAFDPADRGDGLRLWYSTDNLIIDNDIAEVRDISVANAPRNRFVGNRIRHSRRAINLMFAPRTLVEGNQLEHNSTGVVALNSDGLIIRRNRIQHAMDASGAGVALKEVSAALVIGNDIVHCANGIMADSPQNPLNRIVLSQNRIAHNVTGIYFYGEHGGHMALDNHFENNLWPVTVIGMGDPLNDIWWGNYWDNYQGFDRDHDGFGDRPHEIYTYADRIWLATPAAKFFRNSPLLELLDFLEQLAPFSAPNLVLRDTLPRMHPAQK